jgi:hypothetical protein
MGMLKGIGQVLIGLAAMVAIFVGFVAFVRGFAWLSDELMWYVFTAAQLAFAVSLVFLLPLAMLRATRKIACIGLYIASFVFGTCTWILGFSSTYFYWGGFGVIIGLALGVVGLVPVAMLACLGHADWVALSILIGGVVLTYGTRAIALALVAKIGKDEMSARLTI